MAIHEVFTFVEKLPDSDMIIGSCWVMRKKLVAHGTIDKWKVRHVGRGYLQKSRHSNVITTPVIDSASIWLPFGPAATHTLEITVLDNLTAILGGPLDETLYMCLPAGEWRDAEGRARPLVKLIKTLYGITQANLQYYQKAIDFIVDHLNLQDSIAAPCLFLGGNLCESNRVLIQSTLTII